MEIQFYFLKYPFECFFLQKHKIGIIGIIANFAFNSFFIYIIWC